MQKLWRKSNSKLKRKINKIGIWTTICYPVPSNKRFGHAANSHTRIWTDFVNMRNLSRWIVCSLLISQWLVGLSSFCLCCILNSDRDPNIRLVIFAKCVHTINTISSMHVLSFSPAFQREWAQRHCYCLLTTFFIPSTNTDNGMRRITWRSCAHALKKTQYKHIYIYRLIKIHTHYRLHIH